MKFQFKGNRNYVHGTDIYNQILGEIHHCVDLEGGFDISFHGVAHHQISLVNDKPTDESLKFIVKYIDNNLQHQIIYGVDNYGQITERYPYPESEICDKSARSIDDKIISLNDHTGYSFIENIVALNKYLLENMFPDANGKWFFTRLQLKSIVFDNVIPLKLVFKSNFNFKLTKTEIFSEDKSLGFIYFSLV